MMGLGEYLSIPTCPYPPIVQEWAQIPDALVQSFTPDGFCNGDCFSAGQGLGDVVNGWSFAVPQFINASGTGLGMATVSPQGFFQGGPDNWGMAEWGTLGAATIYIVGSIAGDAKRVGKKAKGYGKKAGKKAKSGISIIGVMALVGAGALALYIYSGNSPTATVPGGGQ